MKTFKLRILNSETPTFIRDVVISGNKTFFDLHNFIVEICSLRGDELASFYLCDELWNKYGEISILDMSFDDDKKNPKYESDAQDEEEGLFSVSMKVMEKTAIADEIKTVGQNILYEYDFLAPIQLFIQCTEIGKSVKGESYPYCDFSNGGLEELLELKKAEKEELAFDNLEASDVRDDEFDFEEDDDMDDYEEGDDGEIYDDFQ